MACRVEGRVATVTGAGRAGDLARGAFAAAATESPLAAMGPLGIASDPRDRAHALICLASGESRFVTGASVYHDGAIGLRC